MLTIDALRAYGADVDEGLKRCLGNEAFYLKMVEKAVASFDIGALKAALDDENLSRAFEACHAMKGVLANLALTPMSVPAGELCEALRTRTPADYVPEARRLLELRDQLKAMDT